MNFSWNVFFDAPALAMLLGFPLMVLCFVLPIIVIRHCWETTFARSRKEFWLWTAFIVLTWYFAAFGAFVYAFLKFGPRGRVLAVVGISVGVFLAAELYLLSHRMFDHAVVETGPLIEQAEMTAAEKQKLQSTLNALTYDGTVSLQIVIYLQRILEDKKMDAAETENWNYLLAHKEEVHTDHIYVLMGTGQLPDLSRVRRGGGGL